MRSLEIMATLWPEMSHYRLFAEDPRIKGIRLNTAKADISTIAELTSQAIKYSGGTPLFFDIKGRQLRVEKVFPNRDHLELELNHSITVNTPCVVLFKGGNDPALLIKVEGNHLVFEGGPKYMVTPGDSLNIRAPHQIHGNLFPSKQLFFLETACKLGIRKFMLSYVRSIEEIEELQQIVGKNAEIVAKIEDSKGLDFAEEAFGFSSLLAGPPDNVTLLNARGDLFVELEKPHQILQATKNIIKLDPNAILGSRILLSVTEEEVPSCSDLNEIAWLLDIGYRRFMFCDGLCLNKEALNRSINILISVSKSLGVPYVV